MLDPDLADFKIICNDKTFACHKNVLAAYSDVWKTLFLSNKWRENKNSAIKINGFDSKTVELMINFVYQAELPENEKCTTDLLRLADMYAIADLSDFCEEELADDLSRGNCIETFHVADLLGKKALTQKALEFIADNFKVLVDTQKWNQIIAPYSTALNKIIIILKSK